MASREFIDRNADAGIVYDNYAQYVSLRVKRGDIIAGPVRKTSYYYGPDDLTPDIKDLSPFKNLHILRAPLQCITVDKTSMLGSYPWNRVTIRARDARTGGPVKTIFSEHEIMQVFTGQTGGLAYMEDRTLEQMVGLVIPLVREEETTANLYLLDPEGSAETFTDGLSLFLKELTEDLDATRETVGYQLYAREALRNNMERGKIRFKSILEENVFKFMTLAYARRAELEPHNPRFQTFLKTHIPGYREKGVKWETRNWATPDSMHQERIQHALDAEEYQRHPWSKSEKSDWEIMNCRTEAARNLRVRVRVHSEDVDTTIWRRCFSDLEQLIADAYSTEDFMAIDNIITAIEDAAFYQRRWMPGKYHEDRPIGWRFDWNNKKSKMGVKDVLAQLQMNKRERQNYIPE